jgi:hypothetical protein
MAEPSLRFNVSRLDDSAGLAVEPLALAGLPPGATARVLRRHDDGSLRSAVVTLPAGYNSGLLAGAAGHQGYVLDGRLTAMDGVLAPGHFFFDPPGHRFRWRVAAPVRFILICNGSQAYRPARGTERAAGAIAALRAADVAITPSLSNGKPTGVIRRVLWHDPASGADTRHLTIPAGVAGLGAEWHPCNEEIFCLTRDTVADDPSPLKPGFFLFNPAYGVHGGYRTVNRAEMTLLEWHDGLWALNRVENQAGSPSAAPP